MNPLTDVEIVEQLKALPEWKGEKFIQRRYRFTTFLGAIAFVNRLAEIAEEKNHHPFISIDFKLVTIRLTTWHAGGLSMLDFEEAAIFDDVYSKLTS